MSQANLTLAVVIPAYNEEATIAACLESCLSQTRSIDEIIVVDNNSTDATPSIVAEFAAEHPSITFLHETEQGVVPARDTGIRAATSDIIGRIDADSVLSAEWAQAVVDGFTDDSVAAASGPVIYNDMPAKITGFRADHHIRSTLDKLAKTHRFLFGSNMAVRRSVWNEIASHLCRDEADEMHEDIDIALHLHTEGYKVCYLPDMVGGMSARRLEDSPRDFYSYVMRFERTYRKHGIKSASARIPIFIYLSTYFPLKFIRFTYDAEAEKFSFDNFRNLLRRRHGDDTDDEIVI